MDTSSRDLMYRNKLSPRHKDRRGVIKQWELVEEPIDFLPDDGDRPSAAICFHGAARNRPELDKILRRKVHCITTREQCHHCIDRQRMLQCGALDGTQPDIRIAEVHGHSSYS